MKINITKKKGIKLLTKGHKVEEDIIVGVDSSLFPSGETEITENGTYDVYDKEIVNVNVPIPEGYIQPSGNLDITENGSYNIADKASVNVNVSSGVAINGIIEQYKVQAGKSVNAGDFVEFVKVVSWDSGNFNSGGATNISACKLNDNSVLVAYCDGGNSKYGTAVVLQMAETEIIVGTKVVFNSYANGSLSACRLTDNSVLVAYTGTSGYGKARILTVNGTTITTGTETTFNSAASLYISAESLNSSTALVTYRDNGNTRYGTAIVLSVNGTTITTGVEKVFLSGDLNNPTKICKLTANKALVAFFKSSTLTFAVFSVSGTTISVGATKTVGYVGVSVSVAVLNENKVLVAYSDQVNKTSAVLLTIDGATITVGTESVAINDSETTAFVSAVALNENKALISYDSKIQALTIDGTVITLGVATTLNPYMRLVAFSENTIVGFYDDAGGYYKGLSIDGTTVTATTEVKNETLVLPTETVINGVANTSGTAGESVEVYVPTPKGYTVTLIADDNTNNGQYSIDNGTNWVTIPVGQTTTLSNVETIMFKCASGYGSNFHTTIGTTEYSSNIALLADTQTSENITLTADTTYYISEYTTSDQGGSN